MRAQDHAPTAGAGFARPTNPPQPSAACTCEYGRAADGSEFGYCATCEQAQYEHDMAEMIAAHCEVCGVPLPDEQADDTFPACWRCIEEILESEVRP